MAYITEGELRCYHRDPNVEAFNQKRAMLEKSAAIKKTVFLSHSNDDKILVESTALFLFKHNVNVYIDWKDPEMPETPNPETARILKQKIESLDKFILLATNASRNSRWVPWELGFADVVKGMDNIAILPAKPDFDCWRGTEYVMIYPSIKRSKSGDFAVFPADSKYGDLLTSWLL